MRVALDQPKSECVEVCDFSQANGVAYARLEIRVVVAKSFDVTSHALCHVHSIERQPMHLEL